MCLIGGTTCGYTEQEIGMKKTTVSRGRAEAGWRKLVSASGRTAVGGLLAAALFAAGGAAQAAVNAGSLTIGYETGGDSALASVIHNKYLQQELGDGVSLKVFNSGPAALSAIASGALKFMCVIGLPPVISALASGVPLKIIYAQDRYTTDAGLVARDSTGITSVAGLKGKTVGMVNGSQTTFEMAEYLKSAGLKPSDVKELNMSPPQIQSAWATHQIDAGAVWSPVFNYMADHHGRVLMTDKDLPPTNTSWNVCVTNADYAAAHPSYVTAFLLALNKGNDFAAAHPEKAAKYNANINGISVATAKQINSGYISPSLAQQVTAAALGSSADTVASAGLTQSLKNNWSVLNSTGFIDKAPPADVAKYIGWSYAEAAAKAAAK